MAIVLYLDWALKAETRRHKLLEGLRPSAPSADLFWREAALPNFRTGKVRTEGAYDNITPTAQRWRLGDDSSQPLPVQELEDTKSSYQGTSSRKGGGCSYSVS